MNKIKKELFKILETMDIPEERKDVDKPENIRWLKRNIGINNKDHEGLSDAQEILKMLIK